jgi:hypothetical protein
VRLIYVPIVVANPSDIANGLNYLMDTLLLGGSAPAPAGALPRRFAARTSRSVTHDPKIRQLLPNFLPAARRAVQKRYALERMQVLIHRLEISTGDKAKNRLTIGSCSGKIKPLTFHMLDPKNVAK